MGRVGRGSALGPLESAVMGVLWQAQRPRSVREVLDALNAARDRPLAYTTVMTVLSRLAEREVVRRRKQGRGYVYEALSDNEAEVAVQRVLDDHGEAALASFVDRVGADEELLRRLRRLVEDS